MTPDFARSHMPLRPRIAHFRFVWPALLMAAAAACGNLDGHTSTPSQLATVQGQLTFASGTATALNNVHIAVIWQTPTPGEFNVTQDVPVQAGFPSNYTLPLTEPPPDSALYHPSDYPGLAVAEGVVVAYEDLNGDGRLDLVADDAGAFIDRIVAANSTLSLYYISSSTGSLPDVVASLPSPPRLGYNVLTESCIPVAGGNGLMGPDGGDCTWDVSLPISTPYDLIFSDDPKLNSLMCGTDSLGATVTTGGGSSGVGYDVSANSAPPGGFPEAGVCSTDGRDYQTSVCHVVQENLCTTATDCTYGDFYLDPDASVPPGWPCP